MKRLCQSVSEHDSVNGSGLGARISSCSNSCSEYDSIGTVSVFIVTVIRRSITLMAGIIIIWSGNRFSTMRLTNKLAEYDSMADPRFPIQSSFYRPQRSCGKVMFSQVSVILFTWLGVCVSRHVIGQTSPRLCFHRRLSFCSHGGVCIPA